MKKKKLILNKQTITNLNNGELKNIKGGYITHTCDCPDATENCGTGWGCATNNNCYTDACMWTEPCSHVPFVCEPEK